MARKQKGALSHSERLRYDYLSQNSYYLNDQEREELEVLTAKAAGLLVEQEAVEDQPENFFSALPIATKTPRRSERREGRSSVPKPESFPKLTVQGSAPFLKPSPKAKPVKVKSNRRRGRFKQFVKFLFGLFVLIFLAMVGMFIKGWLETKSGVSELQPAQTAYFDGQASPDGTNILILGSDRRVSDGGVEPRTDTIMVMNVGNSSGKVKLVSFMRDTLVSIDGVSEPGTADSKLNSAFTIGQQYNQQGAELVRQTLKANFDLDIQYYVMIDFETFALAIDTLFPNGVQMDARFATIGGQEVPAVEVPDDLGFASGGGLYQTIAAGPQRMDGKTLLNYARFRGDDEADYGRVRRQQEVMQAVLSQIKEPTKLFTGSEALGKVYGLTSTNLSFPLILKTGLPLVTAGRDGLERETVPALGDWEEAYDRYGGLGLAIDFEAYQQRLAELGLR